MAHQIFPIRLEDLIWLPRNVAARLGNLGPLVICTIATDSLITLLDPFTMRQRSMNADQYWREPFRSLFTNRKLVEYIVLDVEPAVSHHEASSVGNTRYKLADAHVARVSDFGRNDNTSHIRTHLGHLLNAGDCVLGYDFSRANYNDDTEMGNYRGLVLPECYGGNNMELDKPKVGAAENKIMSEYEEFLRDLEENPELRFNISLGDNGASHSYENSSFTIGEKASYLPLERLLEDLDVTEEEGEDDSMRE